MHRNDVLHVGGECLTESLHGHSNMASANPEMLTSSHRVFDQSPLEDGGFV